MRRHIALGTLVATVVALVLVFPAVPTLDTPAQERMTQADLVDPEIPAAANLIHKITLTPATPNIIRVGLANRVNVSVNYVTALPSVRLVAVPRTGGALTPSSYYNVVTKSCCSGTAALYFYVSTAGPTVDHIMLRMSSSTAVKVFETTIPVHYQIR